MAKSNGQDKVYPLSGGGRAGSREGLGLPLQVKRKIEEEKMTKGKKQGGWGVRNYNSLNHGGVDDYVYTDKYGETQEKTIPLRRHNRIVLELNDERIIVENENRRLKLVNKLLVENRSLRDRTNQAIDQFFALGERQRTRRNLEKILGGIFQ